MVVFQSQKPYLGRILRPVLLCVALSYLGFNALNGNHGIYALLREQHKLQSQQEALVKIEAERQDKEHHVMLLSDNSLDLDLLDERVRSVLGYTDKEEYIYIPAKQ